MAIVNITRYYNTGDVMSADNYNDDRDEIVAGVNSIDNAQISPSAAIEESKLAFSGAGHNHSGGSNGQKVQVSDLNASSGMTASKFIRVKSDLTGVESADLPLFVRGFTWFLNKDLVVENDPSVNFPVKANMTCSSLTAYLKSPAVGGSVIIEIRTTTGTLIGSITIPAATQSATSTLFTTPNLTDGMFLRMDITAVGPSYGGGGLTVLLDCSQ